MLEPAYLPALTGTAKQTSWADGLRADFLDQFGKAVVALAEDDRGRGRDVDRGQATALVRGAALAHVDAAWWIDNRGAYSGRLARELDDLIDDDAVDDPIDRVLVFLESRR